MQAVTVRDRGAGVAGPSLPELPYARAAENDVVVQVHAAGFTRREPDRPGTRTDRTGHDRTPSVPGHEVSGVVAELAYGTARLPVGRRGFGLTDRTRNGSLAEYTAVEARNLAPLPADIDHTVAAALPTSGLTVLRRRTRPRPAGGPRPASQGRRLEPAVGAVRPLAEAPAAFAPDRPAPGRTIIHITED